jgi:predicted Zn-dependent protease with MMP-like domain
MASDKTLEQVEEALDAGDFEKASRLAIKATRKKEDDPDAWGMLGEAREGLGDLEGALQAFGKAVELDPEWAAGHAHVAGLHLEFGEMGAAADHLERAFELAEEDAEAIYNFAILTELEGESPTAGRFYGAAAELDPERFPKPVRVTLDEFHAMARRAVDDLPDQIREFIGDVPIVIQNVPERDEKGRFVNNAPLLLGECIGDHTEPDGALDPVTAMPSRIVLYKLNIERASVDKDDLAEQIRITVLHELLHYLGLDEDEVSSRGLR